MDLDSAGSDTERELSRQFYRRLAAFLASFFVVFAGLMAFSHKITTIHTSLLPAALFALGIGYAISVFALMRWWFRARHTYLQQDRDRTPVIESAWEFRSRARFLGWPLVHIRIGGDMRANRSPVRAWIAVGDIALGGLFAFGGCAVAPLSIGGCAIGLLPFGGTALGLIPLGGFSVGIWAFGGMAFGWQAFGGCAIAWSAAAGGAAIAHDFALGANASAAEMNNFAAQTFIENAPFFKTADYVFRHYMAWLNLVWVIPMLAWWRMVRRAKRVRTAGA
jgi:hypothetical protein